MPSVVAITAIILNAHLATERRSRQKLPRMPPIKRASLAACACMHFILLTSLQADATALRAPLNAADRLTSTPSPFVAATPSPAATSTPDSNPLARLAFTIYVPTPEVTPSPSPSNGSYVLLNLEANAAAVVNTSSPGGVTLIIFFGYFGVMAIGGVVLLVRRMKTRARGSGDSVEQAAIDGAAELASEASTSGGDAAAQHEKGDHPTVVGGVADSSSAYTTAVAPTSASHRQHALRVERAGGGGDRAAGGSDHCFVGCGSAVGRAVGAPHRWGLCALELWRGRRGGVRPWK